MLRNLTARAFEVLALNGVKFPETTRRLIDCSQTASRVHCNENDHLQCLTPKSSLWITDLGRLLLGLEAMRGQGISWGEDDFLLQQFANAFLMDLAGNAFFTGCCAASLLSIAATAGIGLKRKAGARINEVRKGALFHRAALIDEEGKGSDDDLDDCWGEVA